MQRQYSHLSKYASDGSRGLLGAELQDRLLGVLLSIQLEDICGDPASVCIYIYIYICNHISNNI